MQPINNDSITTGNWTTGNMSKVEAHKQLPPSFPFRHLLNSNSTYPAPIPRTNASGSLACSTVNSYIDCLQAGNPLAIAALIEGAIIVGSLIVGITCMVRRSACCSERHVHLPILLEGDLEQEIELETNESDPEID